MIQTFSLNPDLLPLIEEDPEFKTEIMRLFEEDGRDLLERLEGAIERADNKEADEAAHALKGIFSNIGIQELWQLALELDTLAREEKIGSESTQAIGLFLSLKRGFENACEYVKTL